MFYQDYLPADIEQTDPQQIFISFYASYILKMILVQLKVDVSV